METFAWTSREERKESKEKGNHIHWDYDDENNADDDADVNSLPSSSSSDSDEDMEGQLSDSAEYERQLKAIAGMALDGGNMVPSPGSSFGESSSSSKDDWTSRKGRQKALAKKRKAKTRGAETADRRGRVRDVCGIGHGDIGVFRRRKLRWVAAWHDEDETGVRERYRASKKRRISWLVCV